MQMPSRSDWTSDWTSVSRNSARAMENIVHNFGLHVRACIYSSSSSYLRLQQWRTAANTQKALKNPKESV